MFVRIKPDQVDAFCEASSTNPSIYERFLSGGKVVKLGDADYCGDRYIQAGGDEEIGDYLTDPEIIKYFNVVNHSDYLEGKQNTKVSQALEMLQYLETNGAISLDGTDPEFIEQTLKQYLNQ